MDVLITLVSSLILLFIGSVFGTRNERHHYQSIRAREQNFLTKPAISSKRIESSRAIQDAIMVSGSVVVSVDYLKRFLASLRFIFGGEVRAFSSLIDRARREAILRMKEAYPDADMYIHTRLETSSISNSSGRDSVGTIEVVAYGTAIKFAEETLVMPS